MLGGAGGRTGGGRAGGGRAADGGGAGGWGAGGVRAIFFFFWILFGYIPAAPRQATYKMLDVHTRFAVIIT